ncbi:hypothetical protein SGUI_2472 [Serinicoccus hydrothermalis]|uniref:Uncharacterized protein n=1 Tax=Serinicoccus hydrothermalis TaxID=1758689 RepID=A0A1B1NEJ3_9MICO|nr:hypothetical protein [Serinicoccus hydrothermalis]ANS79868.1 hypothetical protein SGUI_2472 [Serinicoccus hydrothermalis]
MTMLTTIKVPAQVRDRLKAQAGEAGITLGQYLADLAARGEREERFRRLKSQIAATRPADRASWEQETSAWERAELGDAARHD